MEPAPSVILQPAANPGIGLQIVVGALAGVLAWWLVETITTARAADEEETEADA